MKLLVIAYDGLDRKFWSQIVPDSFTGRFYDYTSEYQETVQSWLSIYSGLTREEHGYEKGWHAFLNKGKHHGINHLPNVWKDINDMGLTTGLFNLPLTYPAFKVDGWMVSGFPSYPDRRVYPKSISHHLDNHQHMVDLHKTSKQYPEDPMLDEPPKLSFTKEEGFHSLVNLIENRLNVLDSVLSENPVDVLFVGYSYLDHAGHLGFNVNGLYTNGVVNASIETMKGMAQADKTLIVSDHGGYFWAEPKMGDRGEWEGLLSIGFNHSQDAVLYIMGDTIDDIPRHEYDIKRAILELVQ